MNELANTATEMMADSTGKRGGDSTPLNETSSAKAEMGNAHDDHMNELAGATTELMTTSKSMGAETGTELGSPRIDAVTGTNGVGCPAADGAGEVHTPMQGDDLDQRLQDEGQDFEEDDSLDDELYFEFQGIDRDGSGTISAAELAGAWISRGEAHTADDVFEYIRRADLNGDALVDYREFFEDALVAEETEDED